MLAKILLIISAAQENGKLKKRKGTETKKKIVHLRYFQIIGMISETFNVG